MPAQALGQVLRNQEGFDPTCCVQAASLAGDQATSFGEALLQRTLGDLVVPACLSHEAGAAAAADMLRACLLRLPTWRKP